MRKAANRIRQISEQYGLGVDPEAYVKDLPVGIQQRVEIIKLLYRHADILILDEPTAVLTPQEAEELFKIMRSLVEQGQIDHLHHPQAERGAWRWPTASPCCGWAKVVGAAARRGRPGDQLATMMVGREVELEVRKKPAKPGEAGAEVARSARAATTART